MTNILRRLFLLVVAMAFALSPMAASAGVGPVAVDDADYVVDEDTPLVVPAPGVLANDLSSGGTLCVSSWDTSTLDGSLGSGMGVDGAFTFTPLADTNGPTTFTYEIAETPSGPCPASVVPSATVTINVTPVNDAPTAVLVEPCLGGFSVQEDSGAYADPDHCAELHNRGPVDEITQSLVEWVVSSNHPELFSAAPSMSIVSTTFGELHFTPAPNAHGSATVTVRGRDSGGTENGGVDLSPALTFTLTISSVNDAPTATADSFIALKDRTLNVGVPGVLINDHDIDGDPLSAAKVTNPAHGVVTLAADGSFSYTPTTGYEGLDAFSYKASDGDKSSPTRVVSLTVTAIPPVATPTPVPTESPAPTATPEETFVEPSPSIEASPLVEPSPSAGVTVAPSSAPSPTPGASAVPGPASGEGGGISLPVLLVIVLFVLLVGFGAALYLPKWLAAQRGGPPDLG